MNIITIIIIRLNPSAILLEGSSSSSNTNNTNPTGGNSGRVRLDVSSLAHYSFYPGQVIMVKGRNPSGYCVLAEQVWDCCAPPSLPLSLGESDNHTIKAKQAISQDDNDNDNNDNETNDNNDNDNDAKMVKISVAAGPFTYVDVYNFSILIVIIIIIIIIMENECSYA